MSTRRAPGATGPSRLRRSLAAGLIAAVGVAGLALDVTPAAAAPETASIPLADLASAPQGGTLANQVGWSVDVGTWHPTQLAYAVAGPNTTQTWTFDRPVGLRFGISGLNSAVGGNECVDLPAGVVAESIHANHQFDPMLARVCRLGGANLSAESVFTLAGPVTDLSLTAVAGGINTRGPSFIEVTYDVPVAAIGGPADGGTYELGSGEALDFSCAGGVGAVAGSATINGDPIDNGAAVDDLGPGTYTIEVTCTDEHGATHTTSVTFEVVDTAPPAGPACPEDGLAVGQAPHLPPGSKPPLVSGTVHQTVEPIVTILGVPLQQLVHQVNCEIVEPVEDVVDDITIPVVTEVKPTLKNLVRGLLR